MGEVEERRRQAHGYDGINIDFEAGAASNRAALTSFIAELGRRLHAAGRLLRMAVSPKSVDSPTRPRSGIFDYAALVPNVDWIFVMNWGIHWMTSAPGPLADLSSVAANADLRRIHAAEDDVDPRRADVRLRLAGQRRRRRGGHAARVHRRPGARRPGRSDPRFDTAAGEWTFTYHSAADGKTHTVWYLDSRAMAVRFALARDRGLGGVGVWRLGAEDAAIRSQAAVAPGIAW